MKRDLVLITGGARSGKSAFAQTLAQEKASSALFVATAEALDDEMAKRIDRHKAARPPAWRTLEEPLEVVAALDGVSERYDLVILDCLTLWVSNLLLRSDEHKEAEGADALDRVAGLLDWYLRHDSSLVVVTNEVGMGIVPENSMARRYRDLLGQANQLVAAAADRVYLLVAGLPVEVSAASAQREARR